MRPIDERVRYTPRAHFRGIITWRCASCGHAQRHRLNPENFKFRCRNKNCAITWYISLQFWLSKARSTRPPRDFPVPEFDDVLPLVNVSPDYHLQDDPVHRVMTETDDGDSEEIHPDDYPGYFKKKS